MTHYKGPFGSVFGGTEPGLVFEPYVLNGLVQARQQTLRAVVKSACAIRSDSVVKKLESLISEDGLDTIENARTKESDLLQVQSSENITDVLPKRAHPVQLILDLEVVQFRTTEKKLDAMMIDVIVEPEIIPESRAEAVVVEKP